MDADDARRPDAIRRFLTARLRGSTIRFVLFFSFAIIFALWFVSAYELVRRVTEAERQAAAMTARFTDGEEQLFTVRAQVLLSSVYARDAMLDATPEAAADHRERLQAIRSQVDRALRGYAANIDTDAERAHWARLQAELDEYWKGLEPLLTGRMPETRADAQAFLRREVMPRRETVVRISDDIRAMNQDALMDQQAAVAALHRILRRQIWWASGIAVTLGLGAAWLAAAYAGWLERRIRDQHVQEQHATRELQRLSAELVHAQEQERRTIARDLHDEIGQALMLVRLDLGTVERSGGLAGAPAQALAEARSTTELAIRTVRDLSQLLHPPMLDDFGLPVTLDAHLRRFSDRSGVRTELTLDGMDGRLPAEVEVCAYRIVQEALTNVAKHADARTCRVGLRRLPDGLVVTVEDDGKGMDKARSARTDVTQGVGLVGVRERAARLGGTVAVDSQPGRGTRLTIQIPVTAGSAPEPIAEVEPAPADEARVHS